VAQHFAKRKNVENLTIDFWKLAILHKNKPEKWLKQRIFLY